MLTIREDSLYIIVQQRSFDMRQKIMIFKSIKEMEKYAISRVEKGFTMRDLNISQAPYVQSSVKLKIDDTVIHCMVGTPVDKKDLDKKRKLR
jgi:hypothetical protein